jgi:hypothetical protein
VTSEQGRFAEFRQLQADAGVLRLPRVAKGRRARQVCLGAPPVGEVDASGPPAGERERPQDARDVLGTHSPDRDML